ncbi:hypothetical protein CHU98_g2401 [Xylaria longipes]|nr:hypothetical protein CHU98_g2401 [Xylaria longipes]
MKITISALALTAMVLAGTSASPVTTNSASTINTVVASKATSTPDPIYPSFLSTVADEVEVVVDHPEPTLTDLKQNDEQKNKCDVKKCKACVHHCGEMKGFPCIFWQCMHSVCKNCNFRIVHTHSPTPSPAQPTKRIKDSE